MTNQHAASPADPDGLDRFPVKPTAGEPPGGPQLDQVRSRIRSVTSRIRGGTTRTLVVGALALVAISGSSVYGLTWIDQQLAPELAAPKIEQLLKDKAVPAFREFATQVARDNSLSIAKQVTQNAVDRMPKIRKQLEDHTVGELNKTIDESTPLTEQRLLALLRRDKPRFEETFNKLGSPEKEASSRSVRELVAILEVGLRKDLKNDVRMLLSTLLHVNDRNRRILTNRALTAEENLIRQLIALYRRIAKDAATPASE